MYMPRPTCLMLALAGALALQAHTAMASDAFTGLGFLGTGNVSDAFGVSAAGSVVVGQSNTTSGGNYQAFRWTHSGGMVSLGFLGTGDSSSALGVSADGSVVVGQSNTTSGGNDEAFRWTQSGGMVGLGFLGTGDYSSANGVSADGSVVVGYSYTTSGGNDEAFRWTQSGGMVGLGFLGTGNYSHAYGVSGDGSVVVGYSNTTSGGNDEAFRWTQSGGMVGLGFLGTGNYSAAIGVSADGNVVVGTANTASVGGSYEAFRWTQSGGMVGLGFLGTGNFSDALGVSAYGNVVVGYSYTTSGGSNREAFRWTQSTGMQSVTAWLAAAGVTLPSGWSLTQAQATNADGSVVVGQGTDPAGQSEAYLARVSSMGSGIINEAVFNQNVAATGGAVSMAGVDLPGLTLYGVHHRTLLDNGLNTRALGNGYGIWATADSGHYDSSNSGVLLGEVGVYRNIDAKGRIGLGVGKTSIRQSLSQGGNARYNGQYVLAELDQQFLPHLQASVLGYYGHFDTQVMRDYRTFTGISSSAGDTQTDSAAVRVRLDLLHIASFDGTTLTPYAAWTWTQATVGAYTESGGIFPVAYDRNQSTENVFRMGAETATPLSGAAQLVLNAQAVHRVERNTAGVTGQVLGLGAFAAPGQSIKQNWVRVMADIDHPVGATGLISVGVNAGTEGGDPSYGGTISYRMAF
jgi:probable HAF family extracellular repeat protein